MSLDANAIGETILQALQNETELPESVCRDIAFHMTDWTNDLDELHQFFSDPSSLSTQQIHQMLIAFLVHVPNHVAAASALLLEQPVRDIFEVGAVEKE